MVGVTSENNRAMIFLQPVQQEASQTNYSTVIIRQQTRELLKNVGSFTDMTEFQTSINFIFG